MVDLAELGDAQRPPNCDQLSNSWDLSPDPGDLKTILIFRLPFSEFSHGLTMDLNTSSEEYVPKIVVEEDLNSSDDSALLSRIEERNRSCPICQHVYTSNTDFLTHSASHYASTMSSASKSSIDSPTYYASRPMSASSSSTASSSLPNSPNSIEAQSVFDYPSRSNTSLAPPQPHHRPPPPSYYSSAAVASNWAAQSQATANFWSAAASANFQTQGAPNPFYGTTSGYQSGYEVNKRLPA